MFLIRFLRITKAEENMFNNDPVNPTTSAKHPKPQNQLAVCSSVSLYTPTAPRVTHVEVSKGVVPPGRQSSCAGPANWDAGEQFRGSSSNIAHFRVPLRVNKNPCTLVAI